MIDMNKGNLNKLVTNYPVELTPKEVENLSQTLSSVRTAREDDKTYTGEGFVNVNNTNNVISLTNEANEKLNQPIPTKVSDLTDSASYQTVSGMDEYLTKTSASENLAPLSVTADIESLKNASSDWNKVSAKLDTTAFSTVSGNYAFKNDLNDYYQKTETSSKGELDIAFESKQDKLIFGYDENNSISSINNTALASQDVTTYSAGQYIEIDENNTISVTGLLPLNEYAQYEPVLIGDSNITATSSKVDSHTQWNLAINSKPVVTDTKLVGENSITAHTTNVSGEWVVGLEESAHNAIASVAGIATDVGTFKTASAGWDKVSAKLDVTSFSTVSGTFLTEIPDTYATKNDLNIASSTLTSIDNDLSGHIDYVSAHAITSLDDYYTKTQVDSTFALKTEIPTTVTQLTDSGNYYQKIETSSKTEITNALNTKVDNPSQQTGLLVYDGDISSWVSMPPDTTIVQGQGSITANYESNSTYTVSLLASAENALKKVVNKIDTTAVEQKYQTKDDMSNYLTTSEASTTYQPIGDYATTSDISDMATQTWVGQQGFYTKASADNDYAPKTITATVNTLTGASASWNEVSAISRIESDLENKKDKQTELNFNGSATKTVKSITQNANGELNVEFADIDLPSQVPNVEITSEDNSVKVTETTDIQTNTKKFDLSIDDRIPDPSTSNPLMDGTASVGLSSKYAREDHVHPSDTSKESVSNKTSVVLGTSNSKYPTDKAVADFVNSSIATNTANYISNNGEPFTSVEELEAYTGTVTNNDYAFVTGTDDAGNTYYDRYKATVSGSTVTWALEYRLNNSSFTAAQWAAINSGVTSDKANYWDGKQDALTAGDNITIAGNVISSEQLFIATFRTTTYQEIKDAYDAGKICLCKDRDAIFILSIINDDYALFTMTNCWADSMYVKRCNAIDNTWVEGRRIYQLKLTFDTTPTAGSSNPVTSDGIKTAIEDSVDQTYSSTSTKAQSGITVNEAFKTRETSSSDDSYTYIGMNRTNQGKEKQYWKLVSFKPTSDYWTFQFEIDVSNGRKSNKSFDSEIYETKRLTIFGNSISAVKRALELRYIAQDGGNSRGYGNNIYYDIDSSGKVTVYIYALNLTNASQLCRLKDVINFQGISNITWHEATGIAGTQPTNPVMFNEVFPAIASTSSNIGSDSVPVYVNKGKPEACNSSNLKAGKDDDGNVIKDTYATKVALDSRVPAPTSTTGTQVLKCINGVIQWVNE